MMKHFFNQMILDIFSWMTFLHKTLGKRILKNTVLSNFKANAFMKNEIDFTSASTLVNVLLLRDRLQNKIFIEVIGR